MDISAMQSEQRTLKAHPHLIFEVIAKQAGTVGKALLEAIMNSADADATKCDIRLESDSFTVSDDGRGFKSRQEVEEWFETLGTPHEEGDALFGRFRMGRGQIFSFGRTVYRSGQFEMEVDVKGKGLAYDLREYPESKHPGCSVTCHLYEPIKPSEQYEVGNKIRDLAAYVDIPVLLNDEQINRMPSTLEWDLESDEAYFKFRDTRGVAVYNLGAFVHRYQAYEFGISAVVVSKKALNVNLARNAILENACPTWKSIRAELLRRGERRTRHAATLDDDGRNLLVTDVLAGRRSLHEITEHRLLREASGGYTTLERLFCDRKPITVAFGDGHLADRLKQTGRAIVLAPRALELFRVWQYGDKTLTIQNFHALLTHIARMALTNIADERDESVKKRVYDRVRDMECVTFETLAEEFLDSHEIILESELSDIDKALLSAARVANVDVQQTISYCHNGNSRRDIMVGRSMRSSAWTDGSKYIALNIELLSRAGRNMASAHELVTTLVHEYCHLGSDLADSHLHDEAFYERFFLVMDPHAASIASATNHFCTQLIRVMTKKKLKIPKMFYRNFDTQNGMDKVQSAT